MTTSRTLRTIGRALGALLLMLAGGCFQIETRVKLHEDGSATITERFQLSQRLMEFENPGGGPVLASELTKEAVMERMKLMGKGTTLVSHEVRDGEGGGRESVSVFKIPDITEFQYASPYVSLPGYSGRCLMKCRLSVRLSADSRHPPGLVVLTFDPVVNDPAKAKVEPSPKIDEKNPPKGPSPAEFQMLRHLQPVVRDLLEGIRLKFTVESYASIYGAWMGPPVRNAQANTHEWDLIDVSDKDLDAYGANFLENEEVMLELEQRQLRGPNILQNLRGMFENLTLPLFYSGDTGWGFPPVMWFRPSRPLFDKFFAGKTLDFGERNGGQRPAKFEEIGWQPPPTAAKP